MPREVPIIRYGMGRASTILSCVVRGVYVLYHPEE